MKKPSPSVTAIQHVASEPPGRIAEVLERGGVGISVVRPDLGESIPSTPSGMDGLIVMGGPMSVYDSDRHPFLRDELRLIERALALRIPVLGVCLGSQLLASVLGAQVARAPHKEIGWMPVMWDVPAAEDRLFRDVSWQPLTVLHWHGDAYPLPQNAVALAHSADTAVQAFRYDDTAYGLLFHIEATPDQVKQMSTEFAGELASEHIDENSLLSDARHYEANLTATSRRVFNAWGDLVKSHYDSK